MGTKIWQTISIIAFYSLFLGPVPWAASTREPPRGISQFVPESWTPSLSQVALAIEEYSKGDKQASQQALSLASQNLADVRDAQLFIVYIQLLQTLDAWEQTDLFEEQKRWVNQREAKARTSVLSEGGTLASLEYSEAFRKATEERLVQLQARFKNRTQPKQIDQP